MMKTLLLIVVGFATVYGPAGWEGGPLYTDRDGTLIYEERATPFVAMDVGFYQAGWVKKGTWVTIKFEDGTVLKAQALDAGPLHEYHIIDNWDMPLIVDVPGYYWHLPGISAIVEVSILVTGPYLER